MTIKGLIQSIKKKRQREISYKREIEALKRKALFNARKEEAITLMKAKAAMERKIQIEKLRHREMQRQAARRIIPYTSAQIEKFAKARFQPIKKIPKIRQIRKIKGRKLLRFNPYTGLPLKIRKLKKRRKIKKYNNYGGFSLTGGEFEFT